MSVGEAKGWSPLRWVLDFVYPPACFACGAPLEGDEILCAACEAQLQPLASENSLKELWIARQKTLSVFVDDVLVGFLFEPVIQKLIHGLKYEGRRNVGRFLGEKLARQFALRMPTFRLDWIVPVPLHRKKQRLRGYNQSTVLARVLSKKWGIPLTEKMIRRVRNTPTNTGLTAAERLENMKDGFVLLPGQTVANQTILLVDDVITTGSTVNACAKPLKAAGASRVLALSVAHPALEHTGGIPTKDLHLG